MNYIFTSERLGFRNWIKEDIPKMAALNADPKVMEFFPALVTEKQTAQFVEVKQKQFIENGYCYFSVEILENKEFIGFIGFSIQKFEADFMPCIDIGWRLAQKYWGKGFATEGAKRCLRFASEDLKIKKVISMASKVNVNSENVMLKIGMKKVKNFIHPNLLENENLKECVLYEIKIRL